MKAKLNKRNQWRLDHRLKAYMVHAGAPEDGAVLVFHYTAQEARVLAWSSGSWIREIADEYTQVWATRIWDEVDAFALGDREKLDSSTPHIIDNPLYCKTCEFWNVGLDARGKCDRCGGPAGDELASVLRNFYQEVIPGGIAGRPPLPAVRWIEQTCTASPSQWSGQTHEEKEIYVRFRWGCLSVEIDQVQILYLDHNDPWNGVMSTDEMIKITGHVLDWSQLEKGE